MFDSRTPLVGVAGLLLAVLVLHAQENPKFSAGADLVVLNVRVSDRSHAHVSGLTQDAFRIIEDGRPQSIGFFMSEDMPVTVGLIIDNSISMWAIRDLLIASAAEFARASNPLDEMFAIAFNEMPSPALPPDTPFTSDTELLRHALMDVVRPRGATALFDAISAGFDYADRGHHLRKALVLISDGGDNASTTTFDQVLKRTQASNVVVYAIALVDPVDRDANPKRLERLARASGGHLVSPTTLAVVTQALQNIAVDIRHSYSIGYTPTSPADGKFHHLRVTASSRDRGELTVSAREGFLAGPAPAGGDLGAN